MDRRSRLAGGVFVLLVGAAVVLSFADRAPGLVFPAVVSLAGTAESVTGVDLFGRDGLDVEVDLVGHVALWASLGAASWWAFRHRIGMAIQAAVLFVLSWAVEIGQAYVTATRTPDPRDLVANAVGIAAGLALAAGVDATAQLVRPTASSSLRSRRRCGSVRPDGTR